MTDQKTQKTIDAMDAKQGRVSGMRTILIISLLLAVGAGLVLFAL